jgi:hypothetical protein
MRVAGAHTDPDRPLKNYVLGLLHGGVYFSFTRNYGSVPAG